MEETNGTNVTRVAAYALDCVYLLFFGLCAVTYPLSIAAGRVDGGDFFISSSIDEPACSGSELQGVAHRVGGMGLCFVAQALAISILVIYTIRCKEICLISHSDAASAYHAASLNRWSAAFGVPSCFGIVGVALFNAKFEIHVHLTFAFIAFFNGVLFIVWQTRVDGIWLSSMGGHCILPDMCTYRARQALCATAIFALVGMFGVFAMSKAVSSGFELLMVVALFLFFATWRNKVHRCIVQMHVVIESDLVASEETATDGTVNPNALLKP